jgi:hypothetical protein
LFQLGKSGGYSFRYFSKEKYFTKSHIIDELSKIPESKYYIPDDIKPSAISREYLFTVSSIFNIWFLLKQILETVSPAKYVELYNLYKAKLSNKMVKKWSNYQVMMNPVIAEKIKNFISVDG